MSSGTKNDVIDQTGTVDIAEQTPMSIKSITAYKVDLPLHEGTYKWAGGKEVSVFDCTIVVIKTVCGLEGVGETTPLGPFYLPAYGEGVRTGIKELGPHLIGEDPRQIAKINAKMDLHLKGHNYVKSCLDMACWDLLGKATGQPLCILLGGRFGSTVPLYRAISQDTPEKMADSIRHYRNNEGYHRFQLKVGGNYSDDIARIKATAVAVSECPGDVLTADANTGWLRHEAVRVCRAVEDVDCYIECPCDAYESNLAVRQSIKHPFVLDENIDSLEALLRAHNDRAMDSINLKISKVGGLFKAKQIRDLCVALGYAMTLEDSWGGDVVTAAIGHLGASTPPKFRFASTDFNSYVTVSTAWGAPQRDKSSGTMSASMEPGLGVALKMDVLGEPVLVVE